MVDEIGLAIVEEVLHIHSLSKLRADHQDVVIVAVLTC